MELKSRLLFVDTNIFEEKNFQFLTHSLGALKVLIDAGEIRLLITEVTKGEVKSHMRKKSLAAVSQIKAIKKNAMILRNLPGIPAHGIFSDIAAKDIEKGLQEAFDAFLESDSIETISVDGVLPSYVFERYFSLKPPFAEGEKEKEFADAFVLKALNDLSSDRQHVIHVISNDKDMMRFAAEHPRLIYSSSIDEYIDAVNKSVLIEPAEFAEKALDKVRPDLMNLIHEKLKDMDDEFKLDGWDSELASVEFHNIELVKANLISVDDQECTYDLEFNFLADTIEIEKDYNRSPFDHEDNRYPFVLENECERTFDAGVSMQIKISYQDKLIDSVEIYDHEPPNGLRLSPPYNERVKYLDINGD